MMQKLKKIWAAICDPKYDRLIFIGLPCLCLFLICLILLPQVRGIAEYSEAAESPIISEATAPANVKATSTPKPAATPKPSPSAKPSPSPSPTPTAAPAALVDTFLKGSSTEKDLYVRICDSAGNRIAGPRFTLTFSYPSGEQYSFKSETDGTCYLVRLEPGDYKVTMSSMDGYKTAAPITCTVKSAVEYVQIEDITDIVPVTDGNVIAAEVKQDVETVVNSEFIPEIIDTPAAASGGVVAVEVPAVDDFGTQLYTYTYNVGENGYLLYKENGLESDVLPNTDELSGELLCGLRETGTPGYYDTVELFNADNTPVYLYDITATPVTETVTTQVGWQNIDGRSYYFDANGAKVVGMKRIDGKLYYFNQYGVMAKTLGIDVSFYNKSIDWNSVKADGIDFAIVRVGGRGWESGLLYDDERFSENLWGAKNAGLQVGVYFYSTAVDAVEAVQEASLVLERLNGASLSYPVFIDVEGSGDWPNGRSDKLSQAARTEIINAFCETVRNGGYSAGVYSGQNFYKYNLDYSAISSYYIWLASYTSLNRVPDFGGYYSMWQFTDSGMVSGINGGVDMNAIF